MARVLVVEDDENLRLVLQDNLEDEGYAVAVAGTAAEARAALADPFDLLILDLMLPDGDGYSLCRDYRAGGGDAAVLMLTARTLEDDLVRGFEVGADDYLAKPYRLRELLARVSALLRRAAGAARPTDRLGPWQVDRAARRIADDGGAEITLTRTEFDLLVYLMDHPDRALDRDTILDHVWGVEVVVDPRTVDNIVHTLKKKLGWHAAAGWRIQTVRGVGYRFGRA